MSYKVGTTIEVTYQAAGAATGLTDVIMEIFDETRAKDGVNFPDVTMTEIGSTGRYYGTYAPDAAGTWRTNIDSATTPGKVVKQHVVTARDVDSVGDDIAALNDLAAARA
ncbi:MAG: hypothetical protein ACYS30_24305 [Planctomycetota bacterium]|jgi:hypothetical protein